MTSMSSHSSVAKLGSRIVLTQGFNMPYGDIKLGPSQSSRGTECTAVIEGITPIQS